MSGSQPVLNKDKANEVLNDGTSIEQTNLSSTSPSRKMSTGVRFSSTLPMGCDEEQKCCDKDDERDNIISNEENESKKNNFNSKRRPSGILNLSPKERESLRSAFHLFDINGDGHIDFQEMNCLLRTLGQRPTEEEVQDLLRRLDIDESGAIEFDEFICLMEERVKQREEADKQVFFEAFKVFDKDGNGLITADELRLVVQAYGNTNFTQEEAEEMIMSADGDGNGEIDYEEFVHLFKSSNLKKTKEDEP